MSAPVCTHNEQLLLQGLKESNTDAFLALYQQYHPALYSYVLRFVKVPAIAEDVLQDVFLKIWEIRHRIDPLRSFQAYLYRISRNSVFKLMKKIAVDEKLRQQVLRQLEQDVLATEVQGTWNEYEKLLHRSVTELPPQRQKVFRLCREEGKTYEQVSDELGISRNTVKEHMVMAMKFIKGHLHRHADVSFLLPLFLLLIP